MVADPVEILQDKIDYRFNAPQLLAEALVHRSFANERRDGRRGDNERLEFLGDAVLGLVVAEALFIRFPDLPEGELTRIRAEVVNAGVLADIARSLDVGSALVLGKGEEKTGGREKESLLADALEAIFGAILCDGGIEAVRRVVLALLGPRLDLIVAGRMRSPDSKTRLQEYLQGRGLSAPTYTTFASSGPDHDRIFQVAVRCGEAVTAEGRGRSKKEAEQAAARTALDLLEAMDKPHRETEDNI